MEVIDFYSQLISPEQNREVQARALEQVDKVFLVFENQDENLLSAEVIEYFDTKFKK
jgi:hypothetical protein